MKIPWQDETDLMEEGAGKRLAQINLDYENETAAILAKEKEWKEAQGGRLTQEQTAWVRAALATSYYNPQNEMFRHCKTKRIKTQNEAYPLGNILK